MIKRMLVAPALLPGAQKIALWISIVGLLTIAAFAAESMGALPIVASGVAGVLIAPLAWAGAWLFTAVSRPQKNTAVKVARA